MKSKFCPICYKTRYVKGDAKIEDDATNRSPCFSCLPAHNLSLKIDEYHSKIRGKTLAGEGLGEEKEKFAQEFYQNEIILSMAASAHLMAFESLYSVYSSHALLLDESPRLIKDIHEDQVMEMQGFLYGLLAKAIEAFCEEGDGIREFVEEVKKELDCHPSMKVYSISKSGKEELPRFDWFADFPSLDLLLKESEDIARYAPKWKKALCRRGGERTCTKADGDPLLNKLHRCVNTLRIVNAALSLSLCPDSFYLLANLDAAENDALTNAVKRVIFKMEDLTQKMPF